MRDGVGRNIPKATGWRGVGTMQRKPEMGLRTLQDTADFAANASRIRNGSEQGINGGMRLTEEMLTPWNNDGLNREWMGRSSSLTQGRMILGLYMAGLIATLALLHVHIQFTIHDLRLHQRQYQVMHRALSLKNATLDRENAVAGENSRHHAMAATRLKMELGRKGEDIVISKDAKDRYMSPVSEQKDQRSVKFADSAKSGIDRRLAKLEELIAGK